MDIGEGVEHSVIQDTHAEIGGVQLTPSDRMGHDMKHAPRDLALLGGHPTFHEPLCVGKPNLGSRHDLKKRIDEILDRRWFTNDGACVQEFEYKLATFLGVRHCVATCNGTQALTLTIRAAELEGEIIVPSFTFVATAHAIQWSSLNPVFCDISRSNFCIDPIRIRECITPATSAIVGVHLWGRPCDADAIIDIGRQHALTVLFDAAQSFGCRYRGKRLGGFGDAEIFSFHATKVLNTFEGGAVATDRDDLAHRLRLMRNLGFDGYDSVVSPGTNAKMPEVCAAMGLTSLDGFERFVEVNRSHFELYCKELSDVPGILIPRYDPRDSPHYHNVVLMIDPAVAGLTRDHLMEILHAEGVLARRYFFPGCHRMEPYRSSYPDRRYPFPVTEEIASKVLSLPTGGAITRDQVAKICDIIRFAILHCEEIVASRNT